MVRILSSEAKSYLMIETLPSIIYPTKFMNKFFTFWQVETTNSNFFLNFFLKIFLICLIHNFNFSQSIFKI